jgi:hypothetical protein
MEIKSFLEYILEARIDVASYDYYEHLGLIVYSRKNFGIITKKITLFDFKNDNVMGFIEVDNLLERNSFDILRSYAPKDWGANIYDFAIQEVYPNPIIPSSVIMPKAISIWKYYYEKRNDVDKIEITKNDPNYKKSYKNNEFGDNIIDDNLKYLNTAYMMNKSDLFLKLKEKSNFLLDKYNYNKLEISKKGENMFKENYNYL